MIMSSPKHHAERRRRQLRVFTLSLCFLAIVLYNRNNFEEAMSSVEHKGNGGGAVVCAVLKDSLRYIDEWVDYYVAGLGFQKFYIYDNSDDFELQRWRQERFQKNSTDDPVQGHQIDLVHLPGDKPQMKAYNRCWKRIQRAKSHEWIAFFDLDEFLVLKEKDKYPTVMDYLNTVPEDVGSLAVNWVMIYFNNHTKYEDKPVTQRFRHRTSKATVAHIKSIARVKYIRHLRNPHYILHKRFSGVVEKDSGGHIPTKFLNHAKPASVIVLNHYHTKSLEEYKERCQRGDVGYKKKNMEKSRFCLADEEILRNHPQNEDILDDLAWQLLKSKVPKYATLYGD